MPRPPASSLRPPPSTPVSALTRWRRDERQPRAYESAGLPAAPAAPAPSADTDGDCRLAHAAERLLARRPAVRAAARPRRAEADLGLLAATAAGAPSAEDRRVCCGGMGGNPRGQPE